MAEAESETVQQRCEARIAALEARVAELERRGGRGAAATAPRGVWDLVSLPRPTLGMATRAASSALLKLAINFATFVYFARLHQLLMSASYKYYIRLLLRRL